MSTFGGITWGGAGGDGTATVATSLVSDLLYHALRLAGVTLGAERTPSPAQYGDAMRAANRMLSRWNTDGLKAQCARIEAFALNPDLKTCTMGPGGDFDTTRPQRILFANLLRADGTRKPIEVVEVDRWADIRIQTESGDPERLYNDRSPGLVNLYLWPQTTASDSQLELFSWKLLERLESALQEVSWAEGYEEAFVHNLALRLAIMWRLPVHPDLRDLARTSLSDLMSLNAPAPTMSCDSAFQSRDQFDVYDYRTNE